MKKRELIIYILLAIVALVSPMTAKSQTFDNVSIAEAPSVCSIAQDSQGILWLGTERGLYSYDGYRTIAHTATPDGITATWRVHSMLVHGEKLYMATEHGLHVYDIRRARYDVKPATDSGDTRAVAIYGNRLWFGGAQGLYSRNLATGETRMESRRLSNVYSLLATRRGLLVGTMTGLTLLNAGKTRSISIGEGRQPLVNALLADGNTVWIGTEGALLSYDWQHTETASPLMGNSIKTLSLHGDNIYAGTDNGLYIYNRKSRQATHALHDSRSPHSIANNIVWAVFADRWGNLWAGTEQGVSAIRHSKIPDITPLSDITQTGDGNCLHLMYRSSDGMMWLGGTNGLIGYTARHGYMPDKKDDVVWFRQTSATHHMSHNRVRRVYDDRQGNVIVCTDHGLNIYNPHTRQMRNVIVVDPTRRYTTAWAYDIVDDGMGRYWISSYMGGVFVVAKEKLLHATTATVTADRHLAEELQGIHVWQLLADGAGKIWARMYDQGLDRIDPTTMRVEHIVGKDRIVNDICLDHKGNVWAAMDGEIKCFATTKGNNRSFVIAGLDNGEMAMLSKVRNGIWAVVGQDCCVLSPEGAMSRFALPGFRPLAMMYDSVSGRVLFGGNDAVASVQVDKLEEHSRDMRHPTLLLSGILVDNKPYVPEEGAATYISDITLSARQNNITFMLTDLPMSGRCANVYAYRLKGVDHAWQNMRGESQEISYSALPPGTYTLEVRVMNAQGVAKDNVFDYRVTILPPWYLSVWAKIVYLLVIVGIAVWAMKFVMMRRRLHEERAAKERVMQESAARSVFFDNLSRQLKKPLGSLFGSILTMLHDEKNANYVQRMEQMRRDVVGMNMLVYKALDMQTANRDKACTTLVDIADFCRRAVDDARSKYGKSAEIEYRTDTPMAYVSVDVVRLQPIVEELIDYAVDNRSGSMPITIGVATAEGKTSIVATIPGMTIKKSDMPFVFNRYFDVAGSGQSDGVNPLALVNEFAEMHGAHTAVDSDQDATTVVVTFESAQGSVAPKVHANGLPTATMPTDMGTADARLLAKITETVEAHVADSDFNVTSLQETLGLGSKLLYRKVKQMTGKTPVEFIRQIRMQRAAILLREGRFSVSEVMYMVGFSNSSYFSKCFQKAYGITPAAWSAGQR